MTVIFFGRVAQAVLSLVMLRVMTSMLSPEEAGRWALLIAVISFFSLGFVGPVGMFINRRLHAWVELGKIRRYMLYYAGYLVALALLISAVFYASSFVYTPVLGISLLWVIVLVGCSIFFATLNQTYIPSLNLLGYRGWFVILSIVTVLISLLASFSLVYWVSPRAELWQMGQLVGQAALAVVGGVLFFHFAEKHKKKNSDVKSLQWNMVKLMGLLGFVWPLVISVLLTWVQTQSYRFIVQDMIGLQALGLFAIGYGVSASLIGSFESVMGAYFVPIFYKRISSENKHKQALAWSEYASVMFSSMVIVVTVVMIFSHEIALVLLDESFVSAADFIVWGALAELARVVVGVYALLAHAGMDTKKLIVPNMVAAISSPLFIVMLVPSWGAVGVGMALVLAGGCAILSSHVLLSKSFNIMMPWKKLMVSGLITLGFLGLGYVGHSWFGESITLMRSICWLLILGILLLGVLYIMLKDQINKEVT